MKAMLDRLTNAIAAAGIATWFTPGLREWTSDISVVAAELMPIAGLVWLGVQTMTHVHNHFRNKGKPE
jgi:uncharacterized membrane protein YfbV (UPF0208 family)